MIIRAASLFVAFTLALASSVQAQPANSLATRVATLEASVADLQQNIVTLQANLANLTASFAKLDGNKNLSTADLVGTYSLTGIDIPLSGFKPGVPPRPAKIVTNGFAGTVTANPDGSASLLVDSCGGSALNLSNGLYSFNDCSSSSPEAGTWSYDNGIVTVHFPDIEATFNVGLGGRVMTTAVLHDHGTDQSSDTLIIVMSRISQP